MPIIIVLNIMLGVFAWGALAVAVVMFVIAAVLLFLLVKNRKQASQRMEEARREWDKEYRNTLATLKQEVFTSINRELQEPMTGIIAPLQSTRIESLPKQARDNMVRALANAQDLLHRLNMLLDFRYTGTSNDASFTFVLPKLTEPKVMFSPLGLSSESEEVEEKDEELIKEDVQNDEKPAEDEKLKSQTVVEQPQAPQSPVVLPPVVEQPALVVAPIDNGMKPIVTMSVDDSNAGLAANVAWESSADKAIGHNKHQFTMLMVDDAPEMCRFARDYFRGEYNVITANNGEQALEKLKENDHIDLVVSDVTMPKMNGLELCHAIKTDLRCSHIPVILLTGRTEDELEMQGLKLGADDYITKPFNAETLRLRVRKLIEQKESRLRQFRESEDVAASTLTTTDVDEAFLQRVIKIVEDNMSNSDFTVEVLGDQLDMSRTYLYKKILSITGKGPGEFVRTLRMKRGKQLLERGQMQVAEVAAAVGYNTPKRFTENFKQEYEMTPTEYQRKARLEKQ